MPQRLLPAGLFVFLLAALPSTAHGHHFFRVCRYRAPLCYPPVIYVPVCPQPWQVVPHVEPVLAAGGVLVAYTPSIVQAMQVREQLKGRWIDVRTLEVLHRGWHVEGQAVRPEHRMVAHTAFLTVGRFLGQGSRAMRTDEGHERFGGARPKR